MRRIPESTPRAGDIVGSTRDVEVPVLAVVDVDMIEPNVRRAISPFVGRIRLSDDQISN